MTPNPVLTLSREQMRSRALAFAKKWQGDQREEANAKSFLDQFFEIFGRDRQAVQAEHEYRVDRDGKSQGRIDLLWPGKLLVEMKSTGKDLDTATAQAFAYLPHIDPEARPRWLLVCDFARFRLYDLGDEPSASPSPSSRQPFADFSLADLPDRLSSFGFIRGDDSEAFQPQPEVNLKAVKLLGSLHDELKKSGFSGHDLERFLVRLLFCLFAEDTDIFPWNSFTRIVEKSQKDGSDLGIRIGRLFHTLDTPSDTRSPHLPDEFRLFPYVNGGLFHEHITPPDTAAAHRSALLACCRFDWSRISPGVFGSLFQGVMEPAERRAKGAHYTSEENIRKLIDPLFLDDLKAEFAKCKQASASRQKRLAQFHDKLATLRFLDPACGCGNFLVVAYRELRALELDLLQEIHGAQKTLPFDIGDIARVNVDQFYGIEIEEFPARIAEVALWLTDHQVNLTFSKAFGRLYTRIPLKKSPTIRHANALRLDWKELLPPKNCSFILGNPPFIGAKYMTSEQREDMAYVSDKIKNAGLLDLVTAWYVKAAEYIQGTAIRCAFVSTNSISQGEQPGILCSHLFSKGIKIQFAYRTFVWDNDASGKAHVHVVIIGFGVETISEKRIFDTNKQGQVSESASNQPIGPYLTFGNPVVITNRSKPLCSVPEINFGNQPIDGGHLLLDDENKNILLNKNPEIKNFLRPYIGADEFLNGGKRWCLWLVDALPEQLNCIPEIMERISAVREFRKSSNRQATRDLAKTPSRFAFVSHREKDFLLIPSVSSERREYIPIGFMSSKTIASNLCLVITDATLYDFGILTSTMHMAWMRTVAGRLEMRYRYSNKLVYNNYPWPTPTDAQKEAIEKAAQAVLDMRQPFLEGGSTLAHLYDPLTMPPVLVKAHAVLDRVVEKAYRKEPFLSDRERVEHLFSLYEKLTTPPSV